MYITILGTAKKKLKKNEKKIELFQNINLCNLITNSDCPNQRKDIFFVLFQYGGYHRRTEGQSAL